MSDHKIKPKRTTTSGAAGVPTTSNLEAGEIAINLADKKLFVRDTSSNILELTTRTIDSLDNTTISSPATGEVLTYNAGSSKWENSGSTAAVWETTEHIAATGQQAFSAVYTVGSLDVFLNGIRLDASDYTAYSGTLIILDTGCAAGDTVYISSYSISAGGLPSQAGNTGKYLTTDGTTATWASVAADTNNYVDSLAFSTSTGVLTVGRSGTLGDLTVDLDGKYAESSHTHSSLNATGGISGLTLTNGISGSNFNITGVNQLTINDPGEGIVFTGTTNVSLYAIDDATDAIMNFGSASELRVNNSKVWTAGNLTPLTIGTTSTTAAAGNHTHNYITQNNNQLRLSASNEVELFNSSGAVIDMYLQYSGGSNSLKGPGGSTIWHAGNDGSGSGLDADLLDGLNSTQFMENSGSWRGSHTDKTRVGGITNGGGEVWFGFAGGLGNVIVDGDYYANEGNSKVWHAGNDGSGSGLDADKLDGKDSSEFLSTASIGLAGSTRVTSIGNFNETQPSGFYQGYNATNAPGTSWYNMLNVRHSNAGNDHGFQTSMSYYDNHLWSRSYQGGTGNNDGTYQTWAKQWSSENDGSGSGLDADLLDGQQASSFLSSATHANRELATNSNSSSYSLSAIELREYAKAGSQTGAWSEAPRISFHWSGRVASSIAMGTNGWIAMMNNPGTGYENMIAKDGYFTGPVIAGYSDERLKIRTGSLNNAVSKIKTLSGFTYLENEKARKLGCTNTESQVGVSAQEVQKVLPEAVSLAPIDFKTDDSTGQTVSKSGEDYLTVDYSRLVPLLIEAIKEQQDQIDELKEKLL